MSADTLREALAAAGVTAVVEGQGRVAVISSTIPLDAASRRRVVALGREHGFTNVALELAPDENLSGD